MLRPLNRCAAVVVGAALLAGCSGDGPVAEPVAAATASPSASPTPSPTLSPTPSPTPPPLSPFEDDPAVQGLRAVAAAEQVAVNTRDLRLPALLAAVTPRRAAQLDDLLGDDLGSYFPGPQPIKVYGVSVVDATTRRVAGCSLEDGWALDREGGTATQPVRVAGGYYSMVLSEGVWRLDATIGDPAVDCSALKGPEDFR